jgi:hypothetical protein
LNRKKRAGEKEGTLKTALKNILNSSMRFFSVKSNRRAVWLVLISLAALVEFLVFAEVRRTFVFYSALEGHAVVEDRMLKRASSREIDLRRYVEEVLLGPVSPGSLPLFPQGTRVLSFLYREGVVYADFSMEALFPAEGGEVFKSFLTLNEGIRRNFSQVKKVNFFIEGTEIFFNEFFDFFANSADIIYKTSQKALTY